MGLTYNSAGKITGFIQTDFGGGMNLFADETKLAENEYREAFNVRNRDNNLTPVGGGVVLSTAPAGRKQGIYGFDSFFVLFVAGHAYYQVVGTTVWVRIAHFEMSSTANYIYVEAVPASTINQKRVLISATNVEGSQLSPAVQQQNIAISGTLAGLVCQDGTNQPWIIFADRSARVTQTYAQWSNDDQGSDGVREYVPIGKQMKFFGGVLYVVSPDGTKLLRSVTGRPLDFVINISIDGNKGGDAYTVAYGVSYNPITCLSAMNSGQLFVGTSFTCYPLTIDYDNLIFGEPKFKNLSPIYTGCVNQFSFLDILGDYAIIDYSSVRSFNAVQQLQSAGQNSVFSLKVSALFEGITQSADVVCAASFKNYAILSVQTIYGYGLLIYDTLKQVWVSFDPTDEPIIGLAVTTILTTPRLFGISTNSVYEFFTTISESFQSSVKFRAIISGDAKKELTSDGFRCVFGRGTFDSSAVLTPYVDEESIDDITQPLTDVQIGILYPAMYPVSFNKGKRIKNVRFNSKGNAETGWKVSSVLRWSNDCPLLHYQLDLKENTTQTSGKQQDEIYAD